MSFHKSFRSSKDCRSSVQLSIRCFNISNFVHIYNPIMGSTAEPERFGKVRPLGSKGSNPLQVLYRQVGLLIKFRCGRSVTASPRTGNVLTSTFDISPSQVIRSCRASSKLLVHPSSFLLFGFTSLVTCRS